MASAAANRSANSPIAKECTLLKCWITPALAPALRNSSSRLTQLPFIAIRDPYAGIKGVFATETPESASNCEKMNRDCARGWSLRNWSKQPPGFISQWFIHLPVLRAICYAQAVFRLAEKESSLWQRIARFIISDGF